MHDPAAKSIDALEDPIGRLPSFWISAQLFLYTVYQPTAGEVCHWCLVSNDNTAELVVPKVCRGHYLFEV